MSKTKIEWTDYTWNPVWGCHAGCEYCYAKGISKRFAYVIAEKETSIASYTEIPNIEELERNRLAYRLQDFKPTFLWGNFRNYKFPKKPSKIFIGSMSDIAFWEPEWIVMIADVIKYYPQHTFQLLTKFPNRYFKIYEMFPKNVLFGITISDSKQVAKVYDFYDTKAALEYQSNMYLFKTFISFEPLLLDNILPQCESNIRDSDWIIIGTMSGKKRIPAKIEVVKHIVNTANRYNKPVFVKQLEINSKIEKDINKFPKDLRIREFC